MSDDDGKEIKLNNVNTSELEIESSDNMFDDLNVFNTNELKLEAEPLQIDNSMNDLSNLESVYLDNDEKNVNISENKMILDSQNMTEPQVNNDIKTIVIDTNNHNERQLEINDDTDFNNN